MTMANETKPVEEFNANAKRAANQAEQAVKQTIDQTRGALDSYAAFAQKAFSPLPFGGTEFAEKMKSYTEKNMAAAQQYIQKLSQAKDFQDIIRIQTEFMQTQFQALGEQTKSLGEAFTKAATEAMKPPFKT